MSEIEDAQVEFVSEERPIGNVSNTPVEQPERFCWFCKETMKDTFNINNGGLEQGKHMMLPKDEGAHYQCYVKEIVKA